MSGRLANRRFRPLPLHQFLHLDSQVLRKLFTAQFSMLAKEVEFAVR